MKFFKNAIVYKLTEKLGLGSLHEVMADHRYVPCGSQEMSRCGWVGPCDTAEQLCHASHGAHLIKMMVEDKIIPAAAVRANVDEKIAVIEREQSRKVYRKERDQIKDEVVLDMLPRAFSRFTPTRALILSDWIVIESPTHKKAEELLNLLRNTLGSLPVAMPDTHQSPSAVMTHWLQSPESKPYEVQVKDSCKLADSLTEGGRIVVRYQELEDDEFVQHLESGKRVIELAAEWDCRLSFTMFEDLRLKQLKITDEALEAYGQDDIETQEADELAMINIMRLEFEKLIPQMLEWFGGEVDHG